MKKTMKTILMSLTVTVLVITGATAGHAASLTEGKTLYNANCAGCHGALDRSNWLGATPLMILTGISNVPEMSKLGTLTADQMLSLSIALDSSPVPDPIRTATRTSTPTPGPIDGAALYDANCQSCHYALATSNKKGSTVAQIQSAINASSGGMGTIQLTGPQITAIAGVLAPSLTPASAPMPTTKPAPGDGVALYNANCARCHGVLASSRVARESSRNIQKAINANKGGMRSIKLSAAQLAYIAVALSGRNSGGSHGGKVYDGATIDSYSSEQCARCHYSDGKIKPEPSTLTDNVIGSGGTGESSYY